MGFMESLGSSFSKSFEAARDRRAVKEQDAFRVAYTGFMDQREAYEKARIDDRGRVAAAHTIADRVKQPDAWQEAYKMLSAGVDPTEVLKQMQTTIWEPIGEGLNVEPVETPEMALPPGLGGEPVSGGRIPSSSNPIDSRIPVTPSAITPPASTPTSGAVAGAVAENAPVSRGPVYDFLSSIGINVPTPVERANQRVRQELGISEEEFNRYTSGYTPSELPPSTVRASHNRLNEDGSFKDEFTTFFFGNDDITTNSLRTAESKALSMIMSDDPALVAKGEEFFLRKPLMIEEELGSLSPELATAVSTIGTPMRNDQDKAVALRTNTTRVLREGYDLIKMVHEDRSSLASTTGLFAGVGDWVREFDNVINLVSKDGRINLADFERSLAAKEREAANVLDNASLQRYRLFNAQLYRFAVSQVRANGESGNDISNKDMQDAIENLKVGNDPDVFIANMMGIMKSTMGKADSELEAMRRANRYTLESIEAIVARDAPHLGNSARSIFDPMGKYLSESDTPMLFDHDFDTSTPELGIDEYLKSAPASVLPELPPEEAPLTAENIMTRDGVPMVVSDELKRLFPQLASIPNSTKLLWNGTTRTFTDEAGNEIR